MRPAVVGLFVAAGLAGAPQVELLSHEVKQLSIEEQVELLQRLRGGWSAYLPKRVAVEGEPWPVLGDLLPPISRLSIKEQEKVVELTRSILRKRLLEPIGGYARAYDKVDKSIRVNRILNRGQFKDPDLPRGGGAYFGFASRKNDYDQNPDLELQNWSFSSGFAGRDVGWVVTIPLKGIRDVKAEDIPAKLRAPAAKLPRQGLGPRAVTGQLYIVRAVHWDESDLVAAFEVIQTDRYGVTFAWKILRRHPKPLLPRSTR